MFLLQPISSLFWLESDIRADCLTRVCSFIFILVFGWLPLPPNQQSDRSLSPSSTFCLNPTPPLLADGFSNLLHWENRSQWEWTVLLYTFLSPLSCLPSSIPHKLLTSFLLFSEEVNLSYSVPHCPSSLIISPLSLPLARSMSKAKKHISVSPIPIQLSSRKKKNPLTYFTHWHVYPHLHLPSLFSFSSRFHQASPSLSSPFHLSSAVHSADMVTS